MINVPNLLTTQFVLQTFPHEAVNRKVRTSIRFTAKCKPQKTSSGQFYGLLNPVCDSADKQMCHGAFTLSRHCTSKEF